MQTTALGFEHTQFDFDATAPQCAQATARDFGVGIAVPDRNSPNPGFDDRTGTWAGPPGVATGFERHRECRTAQAAGAEAAQSASDRDDFRVRAAGGASVAAPEHPIAPVHQRPDAWVGVATSACATPERHSLPHGGLGVHPSCFPLFAIESKNAM